jgi:hypothetical protein
MTLNLNIPNKQWFMYLNTLSSISGDDLTIKPDTRRNLLLEVSGNNSIFIKKGDISYNLTNFITGDASFSNVDVSVNLNPLRTNNSSLGLPGKLWGNAYIRDISVTNISVSGNMTISGTISNVIQIIPRLANDISSSLGSTTNIWQKAFIRDLSSINSINGITWPITGPAGPTGALGVSLNATLTDTDTDISSIRLTTKSRIYQNICGDISWSAVNGYYGLAKDAYPSLNPYSSGVLIFKNWTSYNNPFIDPMSVCWCPKHRIFVCVSQHGGSRVATSTNGIDWTTTLPYTGSGTEIDAKDICWSPELELFVVVGLASSTHPVVTSSNGVDWNISTTGATLVTRNSVCWSAELNLFVSPQYNSSNVIISSNGINWTEITAQNGLWSDICWSAELKIFVAVGGANVMTSNNGRNWNLITTLLTDLRSICWSKELGIFVAVAWSSTYKVMTSKDGINWSVTTDGVTGDGWVSITWCPQIRLFIVVSWGQNIMTSSDGNKWNVVIIIDGRYTWTGCWSPELGIFIVVSERITYISSLKGRPPTSYNVFDSSFNSIDETGKWNFQNMNVTTLSVTGTSTGTSDDRLKHNEIVITNGLEIIDRLTPKFYQKTQVLLDAHYNGDLSNHAWTYEAGLIAQEVLQISDLSYVVGGGDYYEQKYIYKRQTNEVSYNYYEPSANNFEPSNNYYQQRANNYEVSYNLIAQAYNLNYNSVFVYGLAAIKELHTKVKVQDTSILDEELNDLVTRIEALESARQDVSNNIL